LSATSAVGFFQVWDTYAKVVAANYMFHKELTEGIAAALDTRYAGRPFSVLDLGCGDAATFAPLLERRALQSYTGVDLSEAALALAASNLKRLACPVVLKHADFTSALAEASSVDAIHISFALHHLSTQEKAEFFGHAAKKLKVGGLLLLVDVAREEGEPLADYHQAYCDWLRGAFVGLTSEEMDRMCDHIRENDFPEPYSLLRAQAEAAGLRELPGALPHKHHRLMLFAPT
jgi:SAM-dependent methyltransferase